MAYASAINNTKVNYQPQLLFQRLHAALQTIRDGNRDETQESNAQANARWPLNEKINEIKKRFSHPDTLSHSGPVRYILTKVCAALPHEPAAHRHPPMPKNRRFPVSPNHPCRLNSRRIPAPSDPTRHTSPAQSQTQYPWTPSCSAPPPVQPYSTPSS